jgi:hypothetical protein
MRFDIECIYCGNKNAEPLDKITHVEALKQPVNQSFLENDKPIKKGICKNCLNLHKNRLN